MPVAIPSSSAATIANKHEALLLSDALYNHLVLPPQLPHRQDPNLHEIETALIDRLTVSVKHLRDLPDNDYSSIWNLVARGLKVTKNIHATGHVDRAVLERELNGLAESDFLVVYTHSQNCALYIRRSQDLVLGPSVVFEAFETSARNEDILATENALQWDFPGCAVAVSLTTFRENGFISNLTSFLDEASRESLKDFSAAALKAGTTLAEYRNSPEPAIISSMLMALLQEHGRRLAPTLLQKMVRDDVCWKNADKPWKRLPYWLVLRVAISRYLAQQLGGDVGRVEYKFLLAHLLGDFLSHVQHSGIRVDRLDFLKKKICRRLVKLDIDKDRSQKPHVVERIEYLFTRLSPGIQHSVSKATAFIEASWSRQKLRMAKTIPQLPRQASPEDLRFDLKVSGALLYSIWKGYTKPIWRDVDEAQSVSAAEAAKQHLNTFAQSHFGLIDLETTNGKFCNEYMDSPHSTITLVNLHINKYLDNACRVYEGMPELKSTLILNVMDLWVTMDKAACSLYPLLRQFHPVFRPEMLDILLIPAFSDMVRVQKIQLYLRDRIDTCKGSNTSIFEDPVRGSFGQRVYDQSDMSDQLKALHESIETWATKVRNSKEKEWNTKTKEYAALSKRIDESSCIYLVDDDNPLACGYHDPDCSRCYMMRQLSRMRIQAYEHPLPSDPSVAKSTVFELACPESLSVYRDTTWKLMTRLALPHSEDGVEPRCWVREYQQLSGFINNASMSCSLASTTKPFLTTHYSWMSFPVEWDSGKNGVCRPNGLKLAYYDGHSKKWPSRRQQISFLHHVKLQIPKSSPFSQILQDTTFSKNVYGPSSYEIMATASRCPQGLNVHEYLAFQTIASGKSRRWLTVLAELGSANLNFSNEATMLLLSHMAVQCGPSDGSQGAFRLIHGIFRDPGFCETLVQQLLHRLDSLSANWRETYLMETVITLALRLVDFSWASRMDHIAKEALSLLLRARNTCVRWFKLLRAESYKVTDSETAQRFQQYALWAALLCKRTFTCLTYRTMDLEDLSLEIYIQSSIMVHDNLVVKLEALPPFLQHAVTRDMRLSYRLSSLISQSIMQRTDTFRRSLREMWPEEEGCARVFSHVNLETSHWISCQSTAGDEANPQKVLYNLVEGVLLVDGRPMGKLPNDPKKSLVLTELFGNQALLTFPSNRPGMQYVLCVTPQGYQVHIGLGRLGDLIVRAFRGRYSLQLIPRDNFRNDLNWDLPGPLLHDSFHWLNLRNGDILITKKHQPWPDYPFPWYVLSLQNQRCTRAHTYNGDQIRDSVVNPYSPLFNRVTRILDSFEDKDQILVFQPGGNRNLSVELPRLNILFYANRNRVLESPQLQCQIDENQDAGTWYGLRSKLVCTSITNPMHRSILVPLGNLSARSDGCHVTVRIDASGKYGKFSINKALGRIDCAPEPTLVFTKALLHASTSFLLPDPLTGRTGTEEAIQWLQAGISQPWSPLGPPPLTVLEKISQLTPRRVYYPVDLRVMRTDHWIDSLPATIQNASFRPIVDQIIQESATLAMFATKDQAAIEPPELPSSGEPHLHARAMFRQQSVERYLGDASDRTLPKNLTYKPRDRPSTAKIMHRNVLEVAHLIRQWPQNLQTTENLAQRLAQSSIVGGFAETLNAASLSDKLKVDILQNWGSVVRYTRETEDRYRLMFLFGPMSFRLDADIPLLRTLIAFAILGELQELNLPPWDDFDHFQPNQSPQLDYLLRLLKPFKAPPPGNDADGLEAFCSGKLRRKMQLERLKHEARVEEDCKVFANHLLSQWPCLEPTVSGLSQSVLLDIGPALEVIRPEWRRLFMNRELAEHLQQVQTILDRRSSEYRFEPPTVVSSEDTFATRMRGSECVDLRLLLTRPYVVLREALPQPQPPAPTSGSIERPFLSEKDFGRGFSAFAWPNSRSTALGSRAHPSWPRNSGPKHDSVFFPTSREVTESVMKLEIITDRLGTSKSAVRSRYASDFRGSLEAFRRLDHSMGSFKNAMQTREAPIKLKTENVEQQFQRLQAAFNSPSPACSSRRIYWLKAGGLWPIVTKATVLARLGFAASQKTFGSGMRKAIVEMGMNITKLQREIRLHDLALKKVSGRYHEEDSNEGHSNWSPEDYPDWLLLEIESNMMIRPVQIDVALATISPESGSNSVLQMNMGQGKTSCIIPMAAAALANREQLVRVIVPKALLQQTAQLLQARLGGILGRNIRHVPFSRRTPTTEKNIRAFLSIHRETLKSAGVMICQPEHNMSFMLSGRQRLLDEQPAQAGPMIKVQDWLTRVSRDILDESDYTLAVRTQLIYPSGSQMTVDGHPHRWLIVEAVLRLVDDHLVGLPYKFPNSISVILREGGGFPFVFFLRQDVEDELVRNLTADICQGAGGILPLAEQAMPTGDRVAVKDFISSTRPRPSSIERVRALCPDKPSLRQTIYLLRGLLVNRILMMTLKKRWNVEYGLHPRRDPIAVPFHAKGVPSEQSEWGHPDVAILFTCLAFYYDGINQAQLRQCLEHILKSDDPSTEYDTWTKSTDNFPPSLKAWNSINVDDEMQLTEIWKVVRYNGVVIDYFLNNFVFPRHAKQFEVKLQSNGWDIPQFPLDNGPENDKIQVNKSLSTGFSGTNDNRTMLPLNIEQRDLPSLHHTSAEVLTYLLHTRNRRCIMPQDVGVSVLGRASEIDLLKCLRKNKIRVLIDAGAQILEMDNFTLAQQWLRIEPDPLAALYFDEENKPWILTKQGRRTPLLASPFADDLSQCLVYLDEAHTRGTDLRLPPNARGALTLRLGQTKDHTVQGQQNSIGCERTIDQALTRLKAAMRLRQLGTTQSVTFVVPPEVHQSIADLQNKTMHELFDSSDVIQWLLDNTCVNLEQLQPLYFSQGMDYCRRMQAALDHPKFLTDKLQRKSYVQAIKQDDQQSLQNLYEPKMKGRVTGMQTSNNDSLNHFLRELNTRRKAFQDTGKAVHASALQEVEQEREVAFEVESVRQVKKPQHYTAHSFPGLNPSLEAFVRTGRLPADTHYFTHVFQAMSKTGIGRKFKVSTKSTNSKLLETVEFGRTIKPKGEMTTDNFLRPINWILWSPVAQIAVIIIPEEAEALIPIMRNPNSGVATHLIVYAAPITRKMLHFNDLKFHSMPALPSNWKAPSWLQVELGLYSGRLYFEWNEYEHMCELLGIEEGVVQDDEATLEMAVDGAMDDEPTKPEPRCDNASGDRKLAQNPLTFLQEWLDVRRRGQDFAHSPMGFVSQGKSLREDHVFFNQADHTVRDESGALVQPVLRQTADNNAGRDEGYYGVDDMGANEAGDNDSSDDDIEYDESEYASSVVPDSSEAESDSNGY
ncbi:hypothetical protein FZEAL_3610 [Fusarium zealandicum]|uniref:ubiquitinyl hydrolase 1 n=1 Tax=Fusarium zealandicum TaxID=1053134 RepID=A0A8H4UP98_9HYPO|nr:hypothetical protein FZEAL_3610 [Fusarium zealandicum]